MQGLSKELVAKELVVVVSGSSNKNKMEQLSEEKSKKEASSESRAGSVAPSGRTWRPGGVGATGVGAVFKAAPPKSPVSSASSVGPEDPYKHERMEQVGGGESSAGRAPLPPKAVG